MKVQFVESFDINESNEYRKYFGQRKLQMSNPKSNLQSLPKDLQDLAIGAIAKLKKSRPGMPYVVHHINSDHNTDSEDNLALVPKEYHDGIFSRAVEQLEKKDRLKSDYKDLKYAKHLVASIEEINTKIEALNDKFNKNYDTLPFPSDALMSKVYTNREKDVRAFARICAGIFKNDYKKDLKQPRDSRTLFKLSDEIPEEPESEKSDLKK